MNIDKLNRLELEVFNSICEIISSDYFSKKIDKFEKSITEDYEHIQNHYDKKSKVDLGFQRILQTVFYNSNELNKFENNINFIESYTSPVSSDIAFYTKDFLINIDAKSTHIKNNVGDISKRDFKPNQATFVNPVFEENYKGKKIKLNDFVGTLPSYTKNGKPTFTIFVALVYFDDYEKGENFKIEYLTVSCIPHKDIVSKKINKKIVSATKTYKYVNKVDTKKYPKLSSIPGKNLEDKYDAEKFIGYNGFFYLNKNLTKNPITNSIIIRRLQANNYQTVVGFDSTRVYNYKPKGSNTKIEFFLNEYNRFKAYKNGRNLDIESIERLNNKYK